MDRIVDTLIQQWLWDISVFSEPWLYYTIFPVYFFIIFFVIKWVVLTLPVWLPILLILTFFRKHTNDNGSR